MSIPSALLLFVISVGHIAICVYLINWFHGFRAHRLVQKFYRYGMALLAVLGPAGLITRYSDLLWTSPVWFGLPASVQVYAAICGFIAVAVLPYETWKRWQHSEPEVQLSKQTEILDVAGRLGFKPYGHGKRSRQARLPWNEIFQVEMTERTIKLDRLPAALDGLSILHVSDLHLYGIPDRIFFEHVLEVCSEADIVAVTGDILDSKQHYDWVIPVLGRLRWKVAAFAVLGNHDTWYDVPKLRRRIERLGIDLIGGRWKQLEIYGQPLIVMGNELPWLPPAPNLRDCPAEGFRLGLTHTPDRIVWAKQNNIDLLLAGHNHGGQIRVPGFGPILVPSRYSRRYDGGLFHEPPTVLHVSKGLGGTHPMRFNCRPEVTRLVLRSSQFDHNAAAAHGLV